MNGIVSAGLVLCAAALIAAPVAGYGQDKAGSTPAAAASGKEKAGLVPVKIVTPKPLFSGTPKNLKTENLEPPRPEKPRAPFMAPEGTTNVALGKSVTSSDNEPVIGTLKQVTDGDKEGVDGSFVELSFGKQHVQIDLGATCEIYCIVVWHFHGSPGVYRDVVVQVADDPDFVMNVRTVYNNDHDNSSGLGIGKDYEYIETYEGRLFDAKGVKGRYVRLYSNGGTFSDMNRYTEVEVYGKPVK